VGNLRDSRAPLSAALGEALATRLEAIARAHGFHLDGAQRSVAPEFERLDRELAQAREASRSWLRLFARPPAPVTGLYLWGGVGRGKSFLMDAFFQLASEPGRQRHHFHRFMQSVHHALRRLQGAADPLRIVAGEVAQDVRLLCLDEFHVTDIGDAMIMRGLLEGLFAEGVALVTTSNQHPDRLYEHGLQRGQFLPAIELLKRQLRVVHLQGAQDYRLRTLEKAGVYHIPLDDAARRALEQAFDGVAGEHGEDDAVLEIEGRSLRAKRLAPGTAWFDFAELCEGPRGTADYIELARRYHTIALWGVPRFSPSMAESMRRFTWLVDEFYDRRVKLIVAAEAAPRELYGTVTATPEVERTSSRLIEMQTARYLSQPHLA
jgi:cell division protein ZapE